MVYKCIIVGYDGSRAAMKAVDKAAELAKRLGSKLVLLTVVPQPVALLGELLVPEPMDVTEIIENTKRELEKLAQKLKQEYGLQDVEYMVVEGEPATGIVETAEQSGCDLIVVGRRGASKLTRILLGSVSEKVVKYAKKADVLVVETREKE